MSCRQWTSTGECSYGINCRFSHGGAPPSEHAPPPGPDSFMEAGPLPGGYRGAAGGAGGGAGGGYAGNHQGGGYGGGGYGNSGGYGAGGGVGGGGGYAARGGGICFNFRDTGDCRYGLNCRFAHISSDGTVVSGPARPPAWGGEFPGYHHRRPQICFEFRNTGACKYGQGCRFLHDGPGGGIPHPAGGADGGGPPVWGPYNRGAPFVRKDCFQFMREGWCNYGQNCKFAHDSDNTPPPQLQQHAGHHPQQQQQHPQQQQQDPQQQPPQPQDPQQQASQIPTPQQEPQQPSQAVPGSEAGGLDTEQGLDLAPPQQQE